MHCRCCGRKNCARPLKTNKTKDRPVSEGPIPDCPGDGTVVLGQALKPAFSVLQRKEGGMRASTGGGPADSA